MKITKNLQKEDTISQSQSAIETEEADDLFLKDDTLSSSTTKVIEIPKKDEFHYAYQDRSSQVQMKMLDNMKHYLKNMQTVMD